MAVIAPKILKAFLRPIEQQRTGARYLILKVFRSLRGRDAGGHHGCSGKLSTPGAGLLESGRKNPGPRDPRGHASARRFVATLGRSGKKQPPPRNGSSAGRLIGPGEIAHWKAAFEPWPPRIPACRGEWR